MPTTASKRESAKGVAIDLLRQAGEPLHAKEIAKRVLASGRCAGLKGKTPEATISAMLAVGSKPGGPFKRIEKGTYTLSDAPPTTDDPATQHTTRRAATRTTATRGKSKSASPTHTRTRPKRTR